MLTIDSAKAYVLSKMTYGHTEITQAFIVGDVAHIKGINSATSDLNDGASFHWEVWVESNGSLYGEW